MTHILISIKDLKAKIKLYKKDIKTSENSNNDLIRAAAFTHKLNELEDLLKQSKKISLTERNIKRKGFDFLVSKGAKYSSQFPGLITGYTEALKSLL